ncbi:voltage-gated potassium channel [Marasmius fiardii PR-910]|nr:voltage-gated potassium channel [Marasmius fiardii PR-910]
MNDPGFEVPIQQTSDEVTQELDVKTPSGRGRGPEKRLNSKRRSSGKGTETEEERERGDFLRPTRFWLVSTLFPLTAGTVGPLANLFSVCALVQTWRVGPKGERIHDPEWLIAVNIISLVSALAANLLLLFTFARRTRYLVSLPIIIVLWYLSSITLVVLLILTHHLVHTEASHTVSQSYYYALLSAILYAAISSLLMINYILSHPLLPFRAYPPTFATLTLPQRTLMLQTTSLTLYLALGAGLFARVEHWDFVDGLYWADYTLLTIGLGSDFPLQTTTGRGLLLPWAVGGVIIIGLVVGSVRGLVLERGKKKVGKRTVARAVRNWRNGRTDPESHPSLWSKEEFDTMRGIQQRASTTRKYISLGVSTLVFLIVWFGGALVFWYTETQQKWSYLTALYFTYTSLLTIGYGDLLPKSSAGKPFFVLWSLLAVPAVTILISNMGGTVVDWVRNGTLWVGRRTLLPERVHGSDMEDLRGDVARLGGAVEKAELGHGFGGGLAASIAREIRLVSGDMAKKPPKRYPWEDWQRWMKLLSGDEKNTDRWNLLDDDGPLFTGASETIWILDKLCRRLEEVLEAEVEDRRSSSSS